MGQSYSSLEEEQIDDATFSSSTDIKTKDNDKGSPQSVPDLESLVDEKSLKNSDSEENIIISNSMSSENKLVTPEISTMKEKEKEESMTLDPEKLSIGHLEKILSEKNITREDIVETSRTHPNDLDLFYRSYEGEKESNHYKDRVNTYTKIALMMLGLSPSLKDLRFKLVPAKVSEGKFWGAVFLLLGIDVGFPSSETKLKEIEFTNSSSCENLMIEEPENPRKKRNEEEKDNGRIFSRSQSDMATNDSLENLRALLKQKDLEILRLRREFAEALSTSIKNERTTKKLDPVKSHKGMWIMSQDSTDFLNLDEEIKRNLRSEKQKRLKEIRDQMKFILDSDDIQHSSGNWDCCGSTIYAGKGCIK